MIISLDEFKEYVDGVRAIREVKLALTSMPGDPIHPGHISCLQKIYPRIRSEFQNPAYSDVYIITACLVNNDRFLIDKKGYSLIPLNDRCEIIDNIKFGVDYIIPYHPTDPSDATVCEAIELLKPNYFCKGGDRIADETLPEWEVCKKVGCKIIDKVGADKKWSSSNYITENVPLSALGTKVIKPWGWYKYLESKEYYSIKELYIKSHNSISLQSHNNRSEIWFIKSGSGVVIIDDEMYDYNEGSNFNIPKTTKHRLIANKDTLVHEIWVGNSDETDIIRYEDNYGRV